MFLCPQQPVARHFNYDDNDNYDDDDGYTGAAYDSEYAHYYKD